MDPEQKAWLAGVFDRAAPAYDRVGVAYHEHFGRRLVELAGVPADAALLDVGCGRAAVLLDFADGTFDALTAAFLLFFLPDPERAATEFRRVLRPGGRVAVSTWGDEDPRWAWEDDLMAGLRVDRRAIQRPFARPAEVHDLLAGAGFADVTTHREELEIRFADADQWWEWLWSFSLRGVLEQLDAAAVESLRARATARFREAAPAGDHPMLLTAWVVTGNRA
jgi:SAM-dependent methyltransferase